MTISKIYKGVTARDDIIKIYKGSELIYEKEVEPSYPTNVVVFKSDSPRTIKPKYTNTGITLQYSTNGGTTWTNISSGVATPSSNEIWFRGRATGTKRLFTSNDTTNAWAFSGSSVLEVYGNLNFLLCDTLGDEVAPTSLGNNCYSCMFYGCTSLTIAPSLPATTLGTYCYSNMFQGCTSLTIAPELPATTLANSCYRYMFYVCTSFKVSLTKTGSYQYAWRIPTSGTGITAYEWNIGMLENTGGTFTSNPSLGTTYYVENPPV